MTDTDIVYVYAVLRRTPEAAEAVADLRGVAGEPIRLVESADGTQELAAAIGPVPAADFEEAPLKAGLEDLDWLESAARAHHAVVAALVGCGAAVLPLRLATVYRDEDRVRQALDERGDDFLSLLDRLTGHVELGLKIYAAPDTAPPDPDLDPDPDTEPAPASGLGAGRAYLAVRRRRWRTAEDARQAATEAATRLTETAAALAVDRVAHRPQRGDLAGSASGTNVSNDAYLVHADHVDQFRTGVRRAAERLPGVHVEVTGPWAPYSFALQPEPVP
ncbi:GvpL/GvpF family gas vesicle protein [Streptomyces sp. DG2A-72]|uniref:GvpL/GvpF family gas vesicle protein n=1 Tax=Streptomyces sp. DG2A-72 TaxID=3051386 RepID=UPI00265C51E9|nr:GvpL/GvpF family gas vesicle protein [Streptomyces sp. DG2A-72]MDO0937517.1 GvpL/GvpF family gas vesicle protein [Streptomyces sp. DG2A-72]